MLLSSYIRTLMVLIDREHVKRFAMMGALVISGMVLFMPEMASAAPLPWENPIRQVAASLCGPVARGIGIVALVAAGLLIAFGEVKGWIHNMMIVLIGVSIAVLAPSFLGMLGVVSDIACN